MTSRGWQGQIVGVLRALGRTLEMLQEGFGSESDSMWSAHETDSRGPDGEQTLGGKSEGEGTTWEVEGDGGLGRRGLTVDTEGLTASMAEEGLYKVPAGVCTQDVTAAASVEVS